MTERRTWDEFRANGLLWWVNRGLHLFGWAITVEVGEDGIVKSAYPSRCRFRGFTAECETRGFRRLTTFLKREAKALLAVLNEGGPEDEGGGRTDERA